MDWLWRMQWELASLAWRDWSSVATRTGASNHTWWKEIKTSELQSFASWCFVTSTGHCESQGQDWKSAWKNWEDWSDAYSTYQAAQWHSEACAGEFDQVTELCSYQSTFQSSRPEDECIPLNINTIWIIAHIFYTVYHFQGSWDRIVSTETRLYNGSCRVKIPVGAWDFSFPVTFGPALGPTQPSLKWVLGFLHEGHMDRASPSITSVRNEWRYTFLLLSCSFMAWTGTTYFSYLNNFQFLHSFMELVTVFLRHVKNIMTST